MITFAKAASAACVAACALVVSSLPAAAQSGPPRKIFLRDEAGFDGELGSQNLDFDRVQHAAHATGLGRGAR